MSLYAYTTCIRLHTHIYIPVTYTNTLHVYACIHQHVHIRDMVYMYGAVPGLGVARAITRTLLCCVVPFVLLRGHIPVLRL